MEGEKSKRRKGLLVGFNGCVWIDERFTLVMQAKRVGPNCSKVRILNPNQEKFKQTKGETSRKLMPNPQLTLE